MRPNLPQVRGPISEALLTHLRNERTLGLHRLPDVDPLTDDDMHVALWLQLSAQTRNGVVGAAYE